MDQKFALLNNKLDNYNYIEQVGGVSMYWIARAAAAETDGDDRLDLVDEVVYHVGEITLGLGRPDTAEEGARVLGEALLRIGELSGLSEGADKAGFDTIVAKLSKQIALDEAEISRERVLQSVVPVPTRTMLGCTGTCTDGGSISPAFLGDVDPEGQFAGTVAFLRRELVGTSNWGGYERYRGLIVDEIEQIFLRGSETPETEAVEAAQTAALHYGLVFDDMLEAGSNEEAVRIMRRGLGSGWDLVHVAELLLKSANSANKRWAE